MLEQWAMAILNLEEGELKTLGIALSLVGFVIALIVRGDNKFSVTRMPYFFYSAGIFVAYSALEFGWLLSFEAIGNELLWILVGAIFLGIVFLGFAYGVIARARSINAYGHGGYAWLAFVPLANLILLFKGPKEMGPKASRGDMVRAFVGVLAGFGLLIFGGGLTAVSENMMEDLTERASQNPVLQERMFELLIASQGLEASLAQMAAGVGTPIKIDETTSLQRVESDSTTVRYIYEVSVELAALSLFTRMDLRSRNCANAAIRTVIDAGATIEHVYLRRDGSQIEAIAFNRQACG